MVIDVARRKFITAVGTAIATWPFAARAAAGSCSYVNETYKIGPLDVLDVTVFKGLPSMPIANQLFQNTDENCV
jgi:hypothetical protein